MRSSGLFYPSRVILNFVFIPSWISSQCFTTHQTTHSRHSSFLSSSCKVLYFLVNGFHENLWFGKSETVWNKKDWAPFSLKISAAKYLQRFQGCWMKFCRFKELNTVEKSRICSYNFKPKTCLQSEMGRM